MRVRPFALISLSVLAASSLVACSTHKADTHAETHAGTHSTHWSYTGATGPAHWGSLSPDYALCATGKSQSPINIAAPAPRDLPNVAFRYQPSPLEITNNGHTIQVNYAKGSFIELDNQRFDLVQFHFHFPSEHMIQGKHADAEMHLVHKSADGRLAVVGVMLRQGEHNPNLDPICSAIPAAGKEAKLPNVSVNAAALLPADARTFRYDGSLTTPPGTEGVKWSLMTQPITLSAAQLKTFHSFYRGNNRPVQNLNGRVVVEDTSN